MAQQAVYSKERGLRTLKPDANFDGYKAKYPSAIKVKIPSMKTLEKYTFDGVSKAPDGCRIEPDGTCQHGYPSWLIILGIM
jgi:hypothetical protein